MTDLRPGPPAKAHAHTLPAAGAGSAAERLLELVGQHAREVLADTEQVLALAQARAQAIPAPHQLVRALDAAWACIGELLVRQRALELHAAELEHRLTHLAGRVHEDSDARPRERP